MNTTFRAESGDTRGDFWIDHATIVRREAAGGLLQGFAALHAGSLAEMVRLFLGLPPAERAGLVIEKAGDRIYSASEVEMLARRSDFPG